MQLFNINLYLGEKGPKAWMLINEICNTPEANPLSVYIL